MSILFPPHEIHPFSEKQIALLKTFADQAVIAIENVRLFKELQERNNELREALEQQTATSRDLRRDQPFADGLAASLRDDPRQRYTSVRHTERRVIPDRWRGAALRRGRHLDPEIMARMYSYRSGPTETPSRPRSGATNPARARCCRRGCFDAYQTDLYRRRNRFALYRAPPQRRQLLGMLARRITASAALHRHQIKLVETFADQAVIAIDNARLFNELKESLEQQTATNEILSVIASSPTDLQPVLDIVAQNAARVCAAGDAPIRRTYCDELRLVRRMVQLQWMIPRIVGHGSLDSERARDD